MSSRGPIALAVALALGLAPAPALAQSPPSAPSAQEAAYVERMEKGTKLFTAGNFDAAAIEFAEAYKLNPKGAPLVNQALAFKQRFKYAQAVELLELALAKHADTLDANTKKAAEDAIVELRGLLAYVTFVATPKSAVVTIDGEEITLAKPVSLPTGNYAITARAPGHATLEQKLRVVSGDKKTVELKLVALQGMVTVDADADDTSIALDGALVGRGKWAGFVPIGRHQVEFRPAGGRPQVVVIDVVANGELTVTPDEIAARGLEPLPTKPYSRVGFYALVDLTTVNVGGARDRGSLPRAPDGGGFRGGLLGGYSLGKHFALQLGFGYTRVGANEAASNETDYLGSFQIGPGVRFSTGGQTLRGFASLAVGAAFTTARVGVDDVARSNMPYAAFELGIELELKKFLLGLVVDTVGHPTEKEHQPFYGDAIVWNGFGLRLGRAFW